MNEEIKTPKIYQRQFAQKVMPNQEVVVRFFLNGYIVKDYSAVMNLVSEDYIDHSPCNAKGNKGCVEVLRTCADLFDDVRLDILYMIEQNNIVSTLVRFNFVHAHDSFGLKATNKRIVFEAVTNFRLKDGKIKETWGAWPLESIIAQLRS